MDKQTIENHFKGHFQTFYGRYLPKLQKATGDEWKSICSFHEDRDPSLFVNNQTGLFKCFGCETSGDIFTFYAKKHDMTLPGDFSKVLAGIAEDFNIHNGNKQIVKPTVTARYSYLDEAGKLLFQIERLEPKSFRIRRPDGAGWVYNAEGVKIVPYHLPKIIKTDEVIIVEGCKDAEALAEIGFTATTNPFGCGHWPDDFGQYFKNKNVVLLPDNDFPGRQHMHKVAANLKGHAASIRWLELPDLPEKGDVSDFLATFSNKAEATERLAIMAEEAPDWEPPQVKPFSISNTEKSQDLSFPEIIGGVAASFADAYGEITEAPRHFYLMAYLVCVGAALAGKIFLKTLLKVQSRIYVIFLGVSGRGRKSTPIGIVTEFFKSLLPEFGIMFHANSGEGLGVFIEKSPSTLLVYDEFMGFVSKASQKGNTLLGTVTSLFEKNEYQTATKDKQLLIENAYLSMLAACTTDTWERCWNPDFTAIGLVNRLFLVPGNMEKLVPIPPQLSLNQWRTLRENTLAVIRLAREVREYDLTEEAKALYDNWYRHELDHKSLHSVRLDAYALRFMLLLAVSRGTEEIDESIVADSIRLANWQHKVRQLYDPLDADNEMARVETRIRRALSTGAKTRRELQQHTHAQRSGLWIWKSALENLRLNEEVIYEPSTKKYMVVDAL